MKAFILTIVLFIIGTSHSQTVVGGTITTDTPSALIRVDVSALNGGVYCVNVIDGASVTSSKLVIE